MSVCATGEVIFWGMRPYKDALFLLANEADIVRDEYLPKFGVKVPVGTTDSVKELFGKLADLLHLPQKLIGVLLHNCPGDHKSRFVGASKVEEIEEMERVLSASRVSLLQYLQWCNKSGGLEIQIDVEARK